MYENTQAFEDAKDRIVEGARWLHEAVSDAQERFTKAADAGATLAAVVDSYVYSHSGPPVGVPKQDLSVLVKAWQEYMGQHAGNFASPVAK